VLDVEDDEIEVTRDVVEVVSVEEVVLTWTDEVEVPVVLVPAVEDEEALPGDREYRLSP
jgi:hypothetical protein